jgi:hypothetical protein
MIQMMKRSTIKIHLFKNRVKQENQNQDINQLCLDVDLVKDLGVEKEECDHIINFRS